MKIIAFEGIDGSGKTTQFKRQYELLNKSFSVSRYQYSSKDNFWGNIIQDIYSENSGIVQGLFNKSRAIQEVLYGLSARSNMKKISRTSGSILLSDRSIITAYASHLDRLPQWFIDIFEPPLIPDLAIYLDIPAEVGSERLQGRNIRFKDESLKEQKEFYKGYDIIINKKRPRKISKTKIVRVDGALPLEAVTEEVYKNIIDHLQL